jgi:DNA-directed RNA polymerase subunit M/transcription elongation factor TFIIS
MTIIDRAIESTKNRIHYLYESSKGSTASHCVKAEKQEEIQKYILGLIEKEIPKSPKIYTENEFTDADGNRGIKITYVECPNCGTEIDEIRGLPRCIECGQMIDW